MKSNLVRVDFRKNDKSEKAQDNNGFRFNQQKLFEGEVTIFQTKKSGDFQHMRTYESDIRIAVEGIQQGTAQRVTIQADRSDTGLAMP